MKTTNYLIYLSWIVLLLSGTSCRTQETTQQAWQPVGKTGDPNDFIYWTEARNQPRPLKLFFLRYNMKSKNYQPIVVVNEKSNRDTEETEAILTDPLGLAKKHQLVFGVNSNAFGPVPGFLAIRTNHWYEGKPVDVKGWLKTREKAHSPPQKGYTCFYIDKTGKADICNDVNVPQDATLAVAGFNPLILDGKPVKTNPKDTPKHPRTMLGYDRNGYLYFVVVDGRQQGYSEGMTTAEQVELMKELGCYEALNLDGGGSSVFIIKPQDEPLKILNQPPKNTIRPIPNLIGLRKK